MRSEIVTAVEELLVETGDLDAVSIRAIADRVGVTAPSIYLHFADKTALIFAVCEEQYRRLDEVMEAAAAESDEPLHSLRCRGLAYVHFGLEHPEQYRLLFQSKVTPEGYAGRQLAEFAAFAHLVDGVQRCIDAGIYPPGDPVHLAFALWAAAHGVVSLLLAAPDAPWGQREALVERVIGMAGLGLAVGGNRLAVIDDPQP